MPNETLSIASFIAEQSRHSKEVRGSALGTAIKQQFPHVDLKTTYGGLKKFILNHCADSLQWSHKHGQDDIYTHGTEPGRETAIIPSPSRPLTDVELWQAFSKPSSPTVIAVHAETGELTIVPSDSSVDAGFIRIDKISLDEYRSIAQDFLPKINSDVRGQLQNALTARNYWPQWSAVLNRHRSDGIYETWMQWRGEKIIDLLESRLRRVNLPEAIVEGVVRRLTSYSAKVATRRNTLHPDTLHNLASAHAGVNIREIVHRAVDLMSEEELRRIWLPLGVLIDVTGKHRT